MKTTRWALALLLALATPAALAQWSPTRPVRIVVPFPAGGIVDLMARSVSDRLAASLGQPVVVEARPGAMGSVGTEAGARAEPDGHTIVLATISHAVLPAFLKVSWHPSKDFAGVAMLGQVPNLLVVPASLPPKTLRELVEYAKARPGQLNFANAGNGTSQTLGIEQLKKDTGINLVGVGYKGYPQVIPDLAAGQIHFAMVPFGIAAPHVKSGKLRALAVAAPVRSRLLADVPTMAEAGYPESPVISWYAFVVPAATPRAAIQRLNSDIAKALGDPEAVARIEALGGSALTAGTPYDVDAMITAEVERWSKFVRDTGLKLE